MPKRTTTNPDQAADGTVTGGTVTDSSVMEHHERAMNEDPHPEAQRQRADAQDVLAPGEPPDLQILDIAGGYVLVVMSQEADPDAPNLAGRARVRTILAESRAGLSQQIATTLVSDFSLTPAEAEELTATCMPEPAQQAGTVDRSWEEASDEERRQRQWDDGATLTDDQRRDGHQQWR